MVLTSVVACELAMTNATTRYVYSFGVDRVLPPQSALSTSASAHRTARPS